MKKQLRNRLIIPAAILSTMLLAVPAFAQTGVPHSADNTTNPNAENATNPDAQVPPAAPGTAAVAATSSSARGAATAITEMCLSPRISTPSGALRSPR